MAHNLNWPPHRFTFLRWFGLLAIGIAVPVFLTGCEPEKPPPELQPSCEGPALHDNLTDGGWDSQLHVAFHELGAGHFKQREDASLQYIPLEHHANDYFLFVGPNAAQSHKCILEGVGITPVAWSLPATRASNNTLRPFAQLALAFGSCDPNVDTKISSTAAFHRVKLRSRRLVMVAPMVAKYDPPSAVETPEEMEDKNDNFTRWLRLVFLVLNMNMAATMVCIIILVCFCYFFGTHLECFTGFMLCFILYSAAVAMYVSVTQHQDPTPPLSIRKWIEHNNAHTLPLKTLGTTSPGTRYVRYDGCALCSINTVCAQNTCQSCGSAEVFVRASPTTIDPQIASDIMEYFKSTSLNATEASASIQERIDAGELSTVSFGLSFQFVGSRYSKNMLQLRSNCAYVAIAIIFFAGLYMPGRTWYEFRDEEYTEEKEHKKRVSKFIQEKIIPELSKVRSLLSIIEQAVAKANEDLVTLGEKAAQVPDKFPDIIQKIDINILGKTSNPLKANLCEGVPTDVPRFLSSVEASLDTYSFSAQAKHDLCGGQQGIATCTFQLEGLGKQFSGGGFVAESTTAKQISPSEPKLYYSTFKASLNGLQSQRAPTVSGISINGLDAEVDGLQPKDYGPHQLTLTFKFDVNETKKLFEERQHTLQTKLKRLGGIPRTVRDLNTALDAPHDEYEDWGPPLTKHLEFLSEDLIEADYKDSKATGRDLASMISRVKKTLHHYQVESRRKAYLEQPAFERIANNLSGRCIYICGAVQFLPWLVYLFGYVTCVDALPWECHGFYYIFLTLGIRDAMGLGGGGKTGALRSELRAQRSRLVMQFTLPVLGVCCRCEGTAFTFVYLYMLTILNSIDQYLDSASATLALACGWHLAIYMVLIFFGSFALQTLIAQQVQLLVNRDKIREYGTLKYDAAMKAAPAYPSDVLSKHGFTAKTKMEDPSPGGIQIFFEVVRQKLAKQAEDRKIELNTESIALDVKKQQIRGELAVSLANVEAKHKHGRLHNVLRSSAKIADEKRQQEEEEAEVRERVQKDHEDLERKYNAKKLSKLAEDAITTFQEFDEAVAVVIDRARIAQGAEKEKNAAIKKASDTLFWQGLLTNILGLNPETGGPAHFMYEEEEEEETVFFDQAAHNAAMGVARLVTENIPFALLQLLFIEEVKGNLVVSASVLFSTLLAVKNFAAAMGYFWNYCCKTNDLDYALMQERNMSNIPRIEGPS